MADLYSDYAALAAREVEGKDYCVEALNRGSKIAIMAPHGGGIEPGTSEIARTIAGSNLSLYTFEGMKRAGNHDLHITSTRFDEPRAVEMAKSVERIVAIHGEASASETIYLGGRDETLLKALDQALRGAGFQTARHRNPDLRGLAPGNICNRGSAGVGAQLEVSEGLRATCFEALDRAGRKRATDTLTRLVEAVRNGIDAAKAF